MSKVLSLSAGLFCFKHFCFENFSALLYVIICVCVFVYVYVYVYIKLIILNKSKIIQKKYIFSSYMHVLNVCS